MDLGSSRYVPAFFFSRRTPDPRRHSVDVQIKRGLAKAWFDVDLVVRISGEAHGDGKGEEVGSWQLAGERVL